MKNTIKKIIGRSFLILIIPAIVILFFDFTFMPTYITYFCIFVFTMWLVMFTAWGIAPGPVEKYLNDFF